MNRKITSIVIAALSLLLIIFAVSVNRSRELSHYAGKSIEISYIKSTRERADNLVENLKLNNEDIIITNDSSGYYSLIENSNKAFNPKVSFSSNNNAKLVVDRSGFNGDIIRNSTPITFLFYNKENYQEIHVYGTTLPLLSISSESGKPLNTISQDIKIGMSFYLYDNRPNVTTRAFYSDGTLHSRGASSGRLAKKSLKLSLNAYSLGHNKRNNNAPLLGMRGDDDWILNSIAYDETMSHDYICSSIWRDAFSDSDYGNFDNYFEYRYVELIFNNSYAGLFLLGYKPDAKTLQLEENSLGDRMPESSYKFKDWLAAHRDSDDEYDASRNLVVNEHHAVAQSASSITKEARRELEAYIDDISSGNSVNEIISRTDMKNAINAQIFFNVVMAVDNYHEERVDAKNAYLTFKNTNAGRKAYITPWDLDISLGSSYNMLNLDESYKSMELDYDYIVEPRLTPIYRLMELGDKQTINAVQSTYHELRNSKLTLQYINSLFDETESKIYGSGAGIRDQNLYVDDIHRDTSRRNLEDLREFMINRLDSLDNYYTSVSYPDMLEY